MTFAEVLDEVGLDATTEDFGEMFTIEVRALACESWARRNLNRGMKAPVGTSEIQHHANDIDFQIESDFIGLMSPGLPREANDFAAGRSGDELRRRVYGGMFFSGMYAAAFFENDPRKVVERGLLDAAGVPTRFIADVLRGPNSIRPTG